MKIIYRLCNQPIIGERIKMIITNITGGMQESKFIRNYAKNVNNVEVDLYSYGGCFSKEFNLGGRVKIGRYCSIASNVRYLAGNHPLNYVSTSPYFYSKKFAKKDVKDITRNELFIGNDCWIGYGAIITSKCKKIGNGAVVAAGAIVTKDVPPYAIVAGSPARIIKYSFDEQIQKELEDSKWWEYTPEQCLRYYKYIDDPLKISMIIKDDKK